LVREYVTGVRGNWVRALHTAILKQLNIDRLNAEDAGNVHQFVSELAGDFPRWRRFVKSALKLQRDPSASDMQWCKEVLLAWRKAGSAFTERQYSAAAAENAGDDTDDQDLE